MRRALSILILIFSSLALAEVPFPPLPQPMTSFSFEDKDWEIKPTTTPATRQYHSPTPMSIPGGRVIKTLELRALLESNDKVVVVDVLNSKTRKTIPGAFWMYGAGDGSFFAAEQNRFATALEKLTQGEKDRPIVFLCLNSECWLSYNASLHAIEAGYSDVIWYRGGTDSWRGASLEWKEPEKVSW